MNQQQIEAIAQLILSMTPEERQLLEQLIQPAKALRSREQTREQQNRDQSIAAIAQDIQDFEAKYGSAYRNIIESGRMC